MIHFIGRISLSGFITYECVPHNIAIQTRFNGAMISGNGTSYAPFIKSCYTLFTLRSRANYRFSLPKLQYR